MSIDLSQFYRPNAMQKALHESDATFVCAWGGADSGKSWFAIIESLLLSYDFPNNEGLVLRFSYRELKDYNIPKFIEFAQRMGIFIDFKAGSDELILRTCQPEYHSVIKFRSIKEAGARFGQSSKFGSTEIGFFVLEEAQDPRIKESIWHTLVKRLRRWENMPIRPFRRGIVICNPPTPDHWVYRIFWHLKEMPGGRDGDYQIYHTKTTDNVSLENNKPLYDEENFKQMLSSFSQSWQQVYLEGKPAFVPIGRPVFTNFDLNANVAKLDLDSNRRVIRSWDFGRRRSAVLFAQLARVRGDKLSGLEVKRPPLDRIVVLKELLFEDRTTSRMADEVVAFSNSEFPECKFDDIGDNTGRQRKAEFEKSSFEILQSKNIHIRGRPMQYIREKSIQILDDKFAYFVSGVPLVLLDVEGCPILIECLSGAWTRDDKGIPAEDSYYEHVGDCMLNIIANYLVTGQYSREPIKINMPQYSHTAKERVR
jgi:terminase large subunit-like protein